MQEFADALELAYFASLTAPSCHWAKGRKRRSLLCETAGMLAISSVIGPAMGLLLGVPGLELEVLSLFLLLLLIALPLILALVARKRLFVLLASSNVILSGILGFLFHSPVVFLWTYYVLSFLGMLVTFSLGIQDDTPRP